MTRKRRYHLEDAEAAAGRLRDALAPYCERIEVAGSIRRRRPDVGDVELLCIPRPGQTETLFGVVESGTDKLTVALLTMIGKGELAYRLNARGQRVFGPKNKLLTDVASGIPLDVFSTEAGCWGMALVVRTGPAGFCKAFMQRFRALGMAGHAYGGVEDADGNLLDCPEEQDVFDLLAWPWLPPEDRLDASRP